MAAPTSLSVGVSDTEFSRFESDADTVTVTVVAEGTSLSGEEVTLELIKARRNRDVVVATKTISLVDTNPINEDFYLPEIIDSGKQFPKVRRGSYFIRATSVTNPTITADSEDFLVSLITVDRLKKEFLYGAHLRAFEVLAVHNQPQAITGVNITNVSQGHPQAWFKLTYAITTDPNDNTKQVKLLSWCGGPDVKIKPGVFKYTLRHGDTVNYIDVRVNSLELPDQSTAEEILVERAQFDDKRIRDLIDDAISWLEDSELAVYLEPTRIATEFDPTAVTFAEGTDIPTLVNYDVDKRVNGLTFYRPSAGHWMNVKFPYYPIIQFDELYGKVANTRIVTFPLEIIEFHEKGGFMEVVPWNQSVSFQYIGLLWVQALHSVVNLPNFWNFKAVVGFRDTPRVLLDIVAKRAAIDVLSIAGAAYRGGLASTSLSRDGISESVSYSLLAMFGVYTGLINTYQKFIDDALLKAKGAFRGVNLEVL